MVQDLKFKVQSVNIEFWTLNFEFNQTNWKKTREIFLRVQSFLFEDLGLNLELWTFNFELFLQKAYEQLVLLDFDITAFTSVAYQRGSLPRFL